MAIKQVEIPDIGTVMLYKRRGNRSLRLSVTPDGEIRVSMPYWLPYKAGEDFALSKAAWIADHRRVTPPSLQHGQRIGKAHHLHFNPSVQATRVTTRLKLSQVEITHPVHITSEDTAVQQAARTAALRALRKEAGQLLPYRLQQIAERDGFTYRSVSIKHLKSRWGSCTSNKDITLNLYLMQLPWHLIDYVIMHELTHTKVMQHGPPFWQELERHAPGAKRLRKEIGGYRTALDTMPAGMA
jgi:predicted metal-dependent hydrolase